GEPKAPTPAAGNNTTRIATTEFVQAAITALINGAPATLDTLKEIAAAINNDPKFSTTINNALSGKQPLDETLTHLSGKDVAGLLAYLGLGEAAKRDVGTGDNQIPDMGSFMLSVSSVGYQKLPSGLILQWGSIGTTDIPKDLVTHFPIAFPNRCLRVLVSQDYTPDSGAVGYIACAGFSADPVKFITRANQPGLGASFLALGC
ncbi:gp53-like domain-containing protein, partial [Escherichia coli]|uniref:gp53-like domain-containing protein n=2 Tax=Enterobacterales TaxID=91347 RepID=UPI003C6D2136